MTIKFDFPFCCIPSKELDWWISELTDKHPLGFPRIL